MTHTLRVSAAAAFVVVLLVAWAVYRTVERVQDSSQSVTHTQEVLVAIEGALSTLGDAEREARRDVASTERRREALDRAGRILDEDGNRLAMLTADNRRQQAHVQQLRQDTARTMTALRVQADASREGADRPADAEAARLSMDAARATMRAMRVEENQLLADRVRVDQAAGRPLQQVTFGLVGVAAGLLAWTGWLVRIVFVNLLMNGGHAMKGRGTIRVSLATMAGTCQIAFADEGPGIPSDVRDKVFTPFFTTKFAGIGSWSSHGQAAGRGSPREHHDRLPVLRRDHRDRRTSRERGCRGRDLAGPANERALGPVLEAVPVRRVGRGHFARDCPCEAGVGVRVFYHHA